MTSYELQPARVHLLRLAAGTDVVDEITGFARDKGIRAAWVTCLGALRRASLRYYDQAALEYRDFTIDRHLEVLAAVGNVSLLDGEPFLHLHITLGDAEGRAFGGHANAGCEVFSLEVRIEELAGDPPVRVFDSATGLSLWERTAGDG
jgi:uncharacterized protein